MKQIFFLFKYCCFLLLYFIACIYSNNIYGQDSTHTDKKQQFIFIGHGYYNYLLNLYDEPYTYFPKKYVQYSPVFLKYEKFISRKSSVTTVITFTGASSTYNMNVVTGVDVNISPTYTSYNYHYLWMRLGLGERWNYYFISKPRYMVYAGIGVGIAVDLLRYTTDDPSQKNKTYGGLPLYGSLSAGIKYHVSKRWGVYAETGFDDGALAQAGFCLFLNK